MNTSKKKASIIGAGFGGLASAALLAKKGYKVQVFEKNEGPGGRASVLKARGFKFDMGPSWLLMLEVFEKLYEDLGYDFRKEVRLIKPDPQYRAYFSDGSFVDMPVEYKKKLRVFESLEKGAGKKMQTFLEDAKKKYNLSVGHFLYKNADSLLDLFDFPQVLSISSTNIYTTAHKQIKHYFNNNKIQKLLELMYVFLGLSPYNAPSIFTQLNYSDIVQGNYYPMGGFSKIATSLEQIGKSMGAKYHYNSPVKKIVTNDGQVMGIRIADKLVKTDLLISNADYKFTEGLIDNKKFAQYKKSYWDKKIYQPSAFLIYLGLKGKIKNLKHHTLYLDENWEEYSKDIFERNKIPNKGMSIYINKPSESDPSVAPKNCEALMLLVPMPADLYLSKKQKKLFYERVIKRTEKKMDIHIRSKIVYKKIFTAQEFADRYNSFKGNVFGGMSHVLLQNSFLRPTNKSKKLGNLYFAGASTVPGVGVPMALISADLVVKRIENDVKE